MKQKRNLIIKICLSLAIMVFLVAPSLNAYKIENPKSDMEVEIQGPATLEIGEMGYYGCVIHGVYGPFELYWYWGDGSSGTQGAHAYGGNEPATYTVTLTVVDSDDPPKIGVGSIQVKTVLPTDNNITVKKYVKHDDQNLWRSQVSADIGDVLNVKLVINTMGSDILNLSIIDESTEQFYCDGSFDSTIDPENYSFLPGGEYWGPSFGWEFTYIEPETTLEITYDVEVISSYSYQTYLNGFAFNGVNCIAYLAEGKIGPSGFIATDSDYIGVNVDKYPGTVYHVDDDGSEQFTSIQEAIDAASDGDTVYVHAGYYTECLFVDKAIALKGQGAQRTTIDGDQYSAAIAISAGNVTIQGFTILNGRNAGVYIDANDCTLATNTITNNGLDGIYIHASNNNVIRNNAIFNHARGISIRGSYNLIKGNTITSNDEYGIYINYESIPNFIYENNFKGNTIHAKELNFKGNHWQGYSFIEDRVIGNYWDDYEGIDEDENGYGDTPYYIISHTPSSGLVLDIYPHMKPVTFSHRSLLKQ